MEKRKLITKKRKIMMVRTRIRRKSKKREMKKIK